MNMLICVSWQLLDSFTVRPTRNLIWSDALSATKSLMDGNQLIFRCKFYFVSLLCCHNNQFASYLAVVGGC